MGSSPLARGLLRRTDELWKCFRIIPARAGFTWPGCSAGWGTRDHPRSRGVYALLSARITAGNGSSPLARGLPIGRSRLECVGRDHPRSRGVYA